MTERIVKVRRIVSGLVLVAGSAHAADGDRYVHKLGLPDGRTAVVAEGDLEARSIGTYTVRVYEADAAREGDTTFYDSGVILLRDGAIEDVRLADLDGNGDVELVVIVRSAGTGSYLSAQALAISNKQIEARSHVEDLPKDADPVAALTRQTHVDRVQKKGIYHDPNSGAR